MPFAWENRVYSKGRHVGEGMENQGTSARQTLGKIDEFRRKNASKNETASVDRESDGKDSQIEPKWGPGGTQDRRN